MLTELSSPFFWGANSNLFARLFNFVEGEEEARGWKGKNPLIPRPE
jgi:hypothetical protein